MKQRKSPASLAIPVKRIPPSSLANPPCCSCNPAWPVAWPVPLTPSPEAYVLGTRQSNWRFPLLSHVATSNGEFQSNMCISPLSLASPVTSSKPASPTGGLLAPCMHLRRKQPPWVNCFKTTPSGEKVFKTTPNGKICRIICC